MRSILFILSAIPSFLFSQNLTGPELLQKSIKYHDPKGEWEGFRGTLNLTETRPNGPDRTTTVLLDNSTSFFRLDQTRDGEMIMRAEENDGCHHSIKGKELDEGLVEKFKLNCERTKMLRNYYVYLWGLPMKLTDPGTIVHDEVKSVDFQGTSCLSLKVTYSEEVGGDIWYFYFQPETYAMIGYRFYHEESKNDGEYITLDGEEKVGNMVLPKRREWYMNKDDKFLGADILEK